MRIVLSSLSRIIEVMKHFKSKKYYNSNLARRTNKISSDRTRAMHFFVHVDLKVAMSEKK